MSGLLGVDDHVVVCGYGQTGRSVAKDLAAEGVTVVVIERSAELVSRAETDGHHSVLGDALDPESLKEAGVERARGVVLTIPSDSDNLLATMTARELNPDVFIIARTQTNHVKLKLQRVGANRVVNPFDRTGPRIGTEFIRPAVMDLMRIFSESPEADAEVRVREVSVQPGSALHGRSLRELDIRAKLDVIVIAMRREGDDTRFNPDPDRAIEAGDVLVCMGRLASLKTLAEMGRARDGAAS